MDDTSNIQFQRNLLSMYMTKIESMFVQHYKNYLKTNFTYKNAHILYTLCKTCVSNIKC